MISAWLCLGDCWGWSFGRSDTAAGGLSWEVWWLRTGSTVLAVLLSARSCRRLSWEQWLHPLHLLGPALLGCCRLQLSFPFLQWFYCSLHFFAKDGVVILCVCLGTFQYWWISIGLVTVLLRAVFCPAAEYLSFFSEALSWTILDSSSFPLFHSGQVFHELVCPLTVVLPQIFFSLTTQFSRCVWSGTLTHYNASMHVFSYVLEHSCIIDKALFFMSLVLLYNVSYSSRSLELNFQATENCNLFLFLFCFFCSTSHSA